jgi:hypothetical protein
VVVEVEVAVVHPDRTGERERRKAQALAIARDEVQLGRDRAEDRVLRRRGALEDAHGADMHVAHRVLHVQERGIERAHGLHAGKHALTNARPAGWRPSATGRPGAGRGWTVLGVAVSPARAGGRSALQGRALRARSATPSMIRRASVPRSPAPTTISRVFSRRRRRR